MSKGLDSAYRVLSYMSPNSSSSRHSRLCMNQLPATRVVSQFPKKLALRESKLEGSTSSKNRPGQTRVLLRGSSTEFHVVFRLPHHPAEHNINYHSARPALPTHSEAPLVVAYLKTHKPEPPKHTQKKSLRFARITTCHVHACILHKGRALQLERPSLFMVDE